MAKRLFDLTLSLMGLLVLSPLFLAVALAIKLDSPGAVFFRGARVGKDGKPFRIFKFRTMVADASQKGPGITTSGDARITRVGRFLRKTKIDELPQLINVVRGEMSLVGPRPEDPVYVSRYTCEQRRVLSVRPGITSPASLHYRDEEAILDGRDWEKAYVEEILPHKLQIEIQYLERSSWLTDLGLVFRTVAAMFR